MRFKDRSEAGRLLARKLSAHKGAGTVIYALPRGGVVPGVEVANELDCPLDLVIVRKIGHPLQSEYAACAVAEDGDLLCDESEIALLDNEWFQKAAEKEKAEAKRRREVYVGSVGRPSVEGKTAIIVDDGAATGLTMRLAIKEMRHMKPRKIVVALPVISSDAAEKIRKDADELVVVNEPDPLLSAIGGYYDDFPQLTDEEVKEFLGQAKKR